MSQDNSLTIKHHSVTFVGSNCKHNQDAYAQFKVSGGYGFAVCDGVNGVEGGGAIASKMAVESLKRQFRNNQFKHPQKALTNALTLANFQLYDHVQKNDRFKGMGASCGIILVIDGLVYYAYIGNIRIYLLRKDVIYQLTRDHTVAQTQLIANKINKDQLFNHPDFYKVDRALGFTKDVNFSVCKHPLSLEDGDKLLITSDGLYRELSEIQIAEIMNDADASVEFIANKLAQTADDAGGADNITLSVIDSFDAANIPFEPEDNVVSLKDPSSKKVPIIVWIVLGILGLIGILFAISEFSFEDECLIESLGENEIVEENKKKEVKAPIIDTSNVVVLSSVGESKKEEQVETNITPKFIDYQIQKGDNFYRLGIRFNITVQYLERINNVQSNRLRLGRKIRIPIKCVHNVSSGEILSIIASKYSISVKDVLKANQLENADNIKEGMKLYIPLRYDDKITE